jgi:hypothetical protein
MLQIKVMKVVLVFLIFALTTNTTVLASTAGYSLTTRSKMNSVGNETSSKTLFAGYKSNLRTVSYLDTHRIRKLLTPDEVIIIVNPAPETFNSIHAVSIQISKISSNNLSDIFIPPKATS